jgi:hypothetical protein
MGEWLDSVEGAGRGAEAADHRHDRAAEDHPHAQQLARHRLRPVGEPVPRLRTRLHLLLRPADPCLPRFVAGRGFRIPAVRQAGCRGAASPGAVEAGLSLRSDRARHQHRPVPADRGRWKVTRSVIELLHECRHPFTITTKSDRVLRDLDILKPAAALGIASVALSVTSLDPKLGRILEPRAPAGRKRIEAIRRLNAKACPATSRSLRSSRRSPTMSSKPSSRRRSRQAPAAASSFPSGSRTRSRRCFATGSSSISRSSRQGDGGDPSMRGGRDNDPGFFSRMRGQGPWAELLGPASRSRPRNMG